MNPTKAQKLEWIERVLEIGERQYLGPTCCVFEDELGNQAMLWYQRSIVTCGGNVNLPFEDVGYDYYPQGGPRNQARLMWLVFLHLWVEEGEVA